MTACCRQMAIQTRPNNPLMVNTRIQPGHTRYLWAMLGAVLLLSVYVVPFLEYDAFSDDEMRTIIAAGGFHHGPRPFPGGILDYLYWRSPDQALGFTLVARLWGDYAGWTEFTTRVFPYLTGVLVLAMLYRTGRDLFSPLAGLSAALIMASSILFVEYAHKFRTFPLAALATLVTVWCYWRVSLAPIKPGWLSHMGLVAGGVGLLYTHYFATPVLAAVGLFHLLFVAKNRRWWHPVGLFVIVMMIFIPAIHFLIAGFAKSADELDLRAITMMPPELLERTLFYFGNGLALPSVMLFGLAAWAFVRPPRPTDHDTMQYRLWYIWLTAVVTLLLIMVMAVLAGIFPERRIRYLLGVWPLLALLAGVGIWKLAEVRRWLAAVALAGWVVFGAVVNWQATLLIFDDGDQLPVQAWNEWIAPVLALSEPEDVFVYLGHYSDHMGHYTHPAPNRVIIPAYQGEPEMRDALDGRLRVWFGEGRYWNQEGNLALFYGLLDDLGFDYCETYWHDPNLQLKLYARSQAFCVGGEPLMTFGDDMTLMRVEKVYDAAANTLTFNTGWQLDDALPPYSHAVGFYVIDADGDVVAQADVNLGAADGPFLPVQGQLSTTPLGRGVYDVYVGVYDVNTLAKLTAVNLQAGGQTGEIMLVGQLRK